MKSKYKTHGRRIAERDGGFHCHYCGCQLVPSGVKKGDLRYYHPPTGGEQLSERIYAPIVYRYLDGYHEGTVDHLIPQRDGGGNELDNLVLACKKCNSRRRAMPYEEFRGQQ